MDLHVAQAEIGTLPVDAVVVPSNSMGTMTTGIRKYISEHAGSAIETELKSKAPVAIGAAVITDGGNLTASHIIHVPITTHEGDEVVVELLKRGVKAALLAANMRRFESIAFPSLTTGESGPTIAEAARAVVLEFKAHSGAFPQSIYLVDPDPEVAEIFEDAAQSHTR